MIGSIDTIIKEMEMKKMTFDEYSKDALRTLNRHLKWEELVYNAVLGMAGEIGEIADSIKKAKFQGHTYKPEDMAKEAGDLLWYVNLFCLTMGYSLEEVAEMNIEKLRNRYGEEFTSEKSINRNEKDF